MPTNMRGLLDCSLMQHFEFLVSLLILQVPHPVLSPFDALVLIIIEKLAAALTVLPRFILSGVKMGERLTREDVPFWFLEI